MTGKLVIKDGKLVYEGTVELEVGKYKNVTLLNNALGKKIHVIAKAVSLNELVFVSYYEECAFFLDNLEKQSEVDGMGILIEDDRLEVGEPIPASCSFTKI
ncbi:MAG: hypothetical protein PHF44_02815 [Candidatus Pacebacteria bacterium]|nr:hypothetical protein [Candidatus Paceibacterota bacterium]